MSAGDEYYEDLLKIELEYSGERNTAANIWYASCLGAHGATLSALNDLASAISTLVIDNIMEYIADTITLAVTKVSDWTDADGLTGEALSDTAGSLSGGLLSDQVCQLVNLTTNMRYRGGRGRIYLPQATASELESGTAWTTTQVGHITTVVGNVFDGINELEIGDDLLTMVLYHRSGNKVVEQGFESVIGVEGSVIPGTQRRRVRRVGHIA